MLLSFVVASSLAAAAPVDPAQNLVVLAKAWEQVRLFHPWLYERDVAWDQAWVKAAPKAEAAQTPEALAAVIDDMLATLKDPVTGVRRVATHEPREGKLMERVGGVPVVNAWSKAFADSTPSAFEELKSEARVVFDLRGTAGLWTTVDDVGLPVGPSKDCLTPGQRVVVHHGYAFRRNSIYRTVFEERLPVTVKKLASTPRRFAFVIDPNDPLPLLALAMQRCGEAFIVSTGPTDERVVVDTLPLELPGGATAQVRTSSLTPPAGFSVDLVVSPGKPVLDAAVALVKGTQRVKAVPAVPLAPLHGIVDSPYDEATYPSRELRQLGVVRFWMVARRFWAYPHLTTEDYDAVLADFLVRVAAAKDAGEYALALAALTTHLPDAHTGLQSDVLYEQLGQSVPGVFLRVIEGKYIVWRTTAEVAKAGLARGDVLLELDGRPLSERLEFLRKYRTSSHEEGLKAELAYSLLAGKTGSSVTLKVQGATGVKTISVERKPFGELGELEAPEPGPHWKVLEGNLGYLDLVNLELDEVVPALTALADTRALIIDDRGYPKGAAFKLGPLLDVKHPKSVAQFFEPEVQADPERVGARQATLHVLEKVEGPRYTKPTVTLIDDQAISQSEHSGLILEAYAGTTFLGSPTLGANGNITSIWLPGGFRLVFTGLEVRHADGRQLQNIGLVPDVLVRRTIAGVRAGKDEQLDAAVQYLAKKLGPADTAKK